MSQKSPETDDIAGENISKRLRISLISDDDDEVSSEDLGILKIMKSLEAELNYSQNHGFLSINGCDGESCGPSFSDSSSTVMASLDLGSCSSYFVGVGHISIEVSGEDSSCSSSSFTGEGINGRDEVEEDEDEWLERVVYQTPIEEEFLSLYEEEEKRSDLSF